MYEPWGPEIVYKFRVLGTSLQRRVWPLERRDGQPPVEQCLRRALVSLFLIKRGRAAQNRIKDAALPSPCNRSHGNIAHVTS
jgi:hypothetical protein